MFCPSGSGQQDKLPTANDKRRRRKKKSSNKKFKRAFKKHQPVSPIMTTWAENFISAATWQHKHEVACLKARVRALEYENKMLHDFIKRNIDRSQSRETSESDSVESRQDEEMHEGNEDFEVSEEFIQFLTANAKFKEDARQERERLKAKCDAEQNLSDVPEAEENNEEQFRLLYGDQWQRISTLEMVTQSNFINKKDQLRPMYWPNIPFNFNAN